MISIIGMAAAAASLTFNLTCSGTETVKSFFDDKSEAYSKVYRVDLGQKLWCEDECKATHSFAAVSPLQLTFEERRTDTPSERTLLLDVVDRETGAHRVTSTSSNPRDARMTLIITYEGSCERSPFTGFPTFETKF